MPVARARFWRHCSHCNPVIYARVLPDNSRDDDALNHYGKGVILRTVVLDCGHALQFRNPPIIGDKLWCFRCNKPAVRVRDKPKRVNISTATLLDPTTGREI